MKNSEILVEKFDVQNFQQVKNTKWNSKKRIKNSETEKNIEETNALWYRYSITYSVE